MSSAEEVDSISRIRTAIETDRYQTDDQTDLSGNEAVDLYLKHQLSPPDWRVWKQWRVNQTLRAPLVPVDGSLGNTQAFRQLVGHYKRAVYERIHLWSPETRKLR